VYPILFRYGWKHRPFDALSAAEFIEHPLASACCCCNGIVTVTVSTPIPSIDGAATMAIIVYDDVVLLVFCEPLSIVRLVDNPTQT
jgi:hypothetical protein